jgi:hypothetical protein
MRLALVRPPQLNGLVPGDQLLLVGHLVATLREAAGGRIIVLRDRVETGSGSDAAILVEHLAQAQPVIHGIHDFPHAADVASQRAVIEAVHRQINGDLQFNALDYAVLAVVLSPEAQRELIEYLGADDPGFEAWPSVVIFDTETKTTGTTHEQLDNPAGT